MLTLRRANKADAELLWTWANDPQVRWASLNQEPIDWQTHLNWLDKRLNGSDCVILIALDGTEVPIGQIRFDLDFPNRTATVNISIDRERRGKGLAPSLLRSGAEWMWLRSDVDRLQAVVKPDNKASRNSFERAGFTRVDEKIVAGWPVLVYEVQRAT